MSSKFVITMERFSIDSCVREHHVYSGIWEASVGEQLPCECEDGNGTDLFAVLLILFATPIDTSWCCARAQTSNCCAESTTK